MHNINDSFFDGQYKEIWRTLIPAELTVKEVDFILNYFSVNQGSKILDLMCGYGRHAIALAEKGMRVTAVDNLPDYMEEISKKASEEKLEISTVTADASTFKNEEKYDLVLCMGNSIQFFDANGVQGMLKNISSMLSPGAHLLINSWSIAEIAWNSFKQKGWSQVGEVKFLTDSRYLSQPARIETASTMISPDGTIEEKTAIDYIYSLNEIESMMLNSGLKIREVFSIPGRKKFSPGEPRAYIVAVK